MDALSLALVSPQSFTRALAPSPLRVAARSRGLILLPSEEGHPASSSHDDHRAVLTSGKTQPLNYSRGRKGQSLAWNWARSYQSAWAGEGDICLWDSLALFNSPAFQSLLATPFPSVHSAAVIEPSRSSSSLPLLFNLCPLCLLIFFVWLCVNAPPPPELSSTDLPRLFSRILLHHPCFT